MLRPVLLRERNSKLLARLAFIHIDISDTLKSMCRIVNQVMQLFRALDHGRQ